MVIFETSYCARRTAVVAFKETIYNIEFLMCYVKRFTPSEIHVKDRNSSKIIRVAFSVLLRIFILLTPFFSPYTDYIPAHAVRV